jgi:hypothetical protein
MEALSATSRSTLIDELRNAFRGVQPDECDQFLPLLESVRVVFSSIPFSFFDVIFPSGGV